MKKVSILIFGFLLFAIHATAQETGVQFQNAASWQEILDQAKSENKYILVDCYATWCAPCKYMDKTVFPDKEVAKFVSEKFIAVKIQMDKTANDPPLIQGWYREAEKFREEHMVDAFPTYIFFSPNGEALHRFSGGTKTGADFIAKAKQALDPSMQYYTNVVRYKEHLGDSAFLRNAIKVALGVSDRKMAAEIGDHYLDAVNPFLSDNLSVIRLVTISSTNKGYQFITKNQAKVDSIMKGNFVAIIASTVMYGEDIKPYFDTDKTVKKWSKLAKKLKKKYNMIDHSVVDQYEAGYYRAKGNIPAYEKATVAFMEKYKSKLTHHVYNQNAWSFFMLSNNREMLETALRWSEESLKLVPNIPTSNYPNYLDTYANLLYKLGRREEAIKWEKKALEVMPKDHRALKATENTLAKMEKGENTW